MVDNEAERLNKSVGESIKVSAYRKPLSKSKLPRTVGNAQSCIYQSLTRSRLDVISDDVMDKGKTDSGGNFFLDGSADEFTKIDPVLKIYHDCDDGMIPCQRRWKITIPKQYISKSTTKQPAPFDFGKVNLEARLYEDRNCFYQGMRGRDAVSVQDLLARGRDLISDDVMDKGKTDKDGAFELDGSADEALKIDPVLKIYHDCDDGLTVSTERVGFTTMSDPYFQPCQRRWKITIPKQYIGKSSSRKPQPFDFGRVNLEAQISEDRNCV
ncbi:unnamed protein product [Soboliphyme baturini]|uniref:Transthyretin-like family protein n=1 Tax=Soboliphyme baturini TaxID=241478 RepID=A0A183IQB0_9BILA|nr:unnamed protein product [Soboliphyme baturini]